MGITLKTYLKYAIVFLLLCLTMQPAMAVIDDCETGKRWVAYLVNDTIEEDQLIMPSEFFTRDGALITSYDDTNIHEHSYFEFQDTTCQSDDWVLSISGIASKLFYGEILTTVGISTFSYTDDPVLKQNEPKLKKTFRSLTDTLLYQPKDDRLKYAFFGDFTIVFRYKNDTLYAYNSNGGMNVWPGHICKIQGPVVYWERKGDNGYLTEVYYEDYTNGTSYYEDFSDCSNTQEYPECEPDPILEIKAEFELPNCQDSTLRLKAESNYPVDFHWLGPNGFMSDEQNPVIDYEDAVSGKYMVWGRIDPCLDPYYVILDIDIPLLKSLSENIYNSCHGDTIIVGDKIYTESGLYIDTLKTVDGCDSIVISSINFDYRHGEIEVTECSAKGYYFNGEYLHISGTYKDTVKVPGCNCDSIVTLKLTMLDIPLNVFNLDICREDSSIVDGHTFTRAGVFRDTLQKRDGCDSLVVFNVKLKPQKDTTLIYRLCSDKPVLGPDGVLYDKDTLFTKLVAIEGYDCKVKTRFDVKVSPAIGIADTIIELCGTHTTIVKLDSVHYADYTWMPKEGVKQPKSRESSITFTGDTAEYKVRIQRNHCQDTVDVLLTSAEAPIIEKAEYNTNSEKLLIEVSNGTAPYMYKMDSLAGAWKDDYDFGDLKIGVHVAYVTDARGCTVRKPFHYFIPVIPAKFMTPNGDGVHDTWEIKNLELYSVYTIKIFDRWGKLLKRYNNYYDGWDGTYLGHKMPTTDYWYTISIDLNEQDLAGHFTLLRK